VKGSFLTSFWAEAIYTNYFLNRYLIHLIFKKTPYELFEGWKPNISYFRTFGCKCLIHNKGKEKLGKFDSTGDEGILVSYSKHKKAWRVYNKHIRIIEESIRIVFYESNDGRLSYSPIPRIETEQI